MGKNSLSSLLLSLVICFCFVAGSKTKERYHCSGCAKALVENGGDGDELEIEEAEEDICGCKKRAPFYSLIAFAKVVLCRFRLI